MSETAAILNLPMVFEFEGKSLQVKRPDYHVEAEFSRWCEARAHQKILSHANDMPPGVLALHLEGWRREIAAEVYEFDQPQVMLTLLSKAGRLEFAFLRLARSNGTEVTRALVQRLADHPGKWNEFQELCGRCDNPLAPTPPPAQAEEGRESA